MKRIKSQQELQLELLQIKEITTCRQKKNGTRIFQLPIKKYGQFIEVGSFKSGYVRRMNGGYTPYQLNKTEDYDHFYKAYEWIGEEQKWTGKYNKHMCRRRILIDNEYDRINYLITYCLKNYYINQANMIEDGKYIPKWKHESLIKSTKMACEKYTWSGGQITDNETGEIYVHDQHAYWNKLPNSDIQVIIDGHRYKIK